LPAIAVNLSKIKYKLLICAMQRGRQRKANDESSLEREVSLVFTLV
jgi:hypothetical protein